MVAGKEAVRERAAASTPGGLPGRYAPKVTDEGQAEVDRPGRRWLRPLLVRVVIDTAALLGAILVLSLIRLPERTADGRYVFDVPLLDTTGAVPADVLLLGVILALVSTFVRPVLAAVLGLAIVRTFGLTVLVVNAFALLLAMWLAIEISGMQVVVADPRWLWLAVIAVALSLLLFAVETLLGFNRPRLDDAGSVQPLWRLADRLPASGRNRPLENLRLAEVQEIILQYGLDISLAGTPLARLRGVSDRLLGRDPDEFGSLSAPAKVRVMLQRLGPTYVKVGQMISSRSDELPPVWREELDKLQSTVPPFPVEQAEAIIRTELGASPDTLFATFEREPLGAASLAQVHRATLLDGTEVAVKVQRPNTQAMVRADLGDMEDLARQAERRIETARTMNLASMIHEFGQGVLTELDYGIEAYQAQRLAEVITGLEGVHVPRVFPELSSSRVVTYEFVRGVKATNVAALDEAGVDRDLVALEIPAGDHQADRCRGVLPRRPAPGQHRHRSRDWHGHLPGPGPRRRSSMPRGASSSSSSCTRSTSATRAVSRTRSWPSASAPGSSTKTRSAATSPASCISIGHTARRRSRRS